MYTHFLYRPLLINLTLVLLILCANKCDCARLNTGPETTPLAGAEPIQPTLVSEITEDMINAAKAQSKTFLADQLEKLQKEPRTNKQVTYINQADNTKSTALHWAVESAFNQPAMVKALLERGANPNLMNNQNWTALAQAVFSAPEHNLPVIKLLLDAGADPLAGTDATTNPLAMVMETSHDLNNSNDQRRAVMELMLTKVPVANINNQYEAKNTLLHYAMKKNDAVAVDLLLKKEAKYTGNEVKNDANQTPIDLLAGANIKIKALFIGKQPNP